jgi:uncharacterized protein
MMIFAIIMVFAVVQSLFGIGLLVFGTPTLLLLGYPFSQALAILLPASLSVSLLQLSMAQRIDRGFALQFGVWCLIPLVTVLTLILIFHVQTSLNLLVAFALALFAVFRAFPTLDERARKWVIKHQREWLLLMGLVHGLSNLGGGLLTILATSQHREKDRMRGLIAFCYTCFATSQLCVLALLNPGLFGWQQLGFAATSALVFLSIGRHVFRWVSAPAFNRLFTAFMASYASLLCARAFGLF